MRLHCTNRIPHGRGLGSSAAAIVAGVVLGRTLAGLPRDVAAELSWAAAAEGHPDNVAPALLGRYTIAWSNGDAAQSRALAIPVHEDVRAVVFVPEARLATERARSLLPAQVDFGAATFNLGRSALLTAALTANPELLLEATSDRLHQGARREAYPDSLALVERLRAAGVAAAISGAGPTVLALVAGDAAADDVARESIHGFVAQRLAVDGDGAAVAIVTES